MKIICKRGQKDYYDYLIGVYGEDSKIVLDRREFEIPMMTQPTFVRMHICGKTYDGFFKDDKYYWGEQLKEVGTIPKKGWGRYMYSSAYRRLVAPKEYGEYVIVCDLLKRSHDAHFLPYVDIDTNHNINEKCPILLQVSKSNYCRYPILNDLGFNKVLPAQEIYLMLCEWLAPKDEITSNQSNEEKIISNGFDLKTSFRKDKK